MLHERAHSPPREEGCPSESISLDSEGGVVAHKLRFGMRFLNTVCERPPRLRRFGGFAAFYYCAATPPLEEGSSLTCQFIHTFYDLRRSRNCDIRGGHRPPLQ